MSMELIGREDAKAEIRKAFPTLADRVDINSILNGLPTVKAIPIEVVEQIRAEIESRLQGVNIALDVLAKDHALIPTMQGAKTTLEELLEITDKAIKEQTT